MFTLERFILSPDVVDLLMGYVAVVMVLGIGSLVWMIWGAKR